MSASHASIRFLCPVAPQSDRPLLVYLPGMDGTGHLFGLQARDLAEQFDIRCLSIPNDDTSSWERLVEKTSELISKVLAAKSERSVYLCGESFGGCLGLQVALHYPQLVHRLITINPASSFARRSWLGWGVPFIHQMSQSVYQFASIGLLPFLGSLGRMDSSDRQALLQAMKSVSPQTASWRISLLQQFEARADWLSRISQPVLAIAGGGDCVLPSVEEVKRLVNLMPDARQFILPHSGHACLLERDVNLYRILHETAFLPETIEVNQ